ncbi:RrF2 family transcriptional regulator [Gryllotalpicola protaetiae]|jgi:Rrf2 family protein|uniref:Rrf2 family transcriptional regulator n=1 Tax=Gryllotalpicola protaetiae TaxID=2419771 RepID=A0A387BU95_9MICO|nr:Rrf2 family transcriptional regulator [Gryllotalpicola protaetiae]AYG04616.1 Rrf2 family transcriptional regulator [Gryllotalpicola protaetiae]
MRLSGGVEWALHCCVVLSRGVEEPVPVARLAELYDVSPTYLAKHLQSLAADGLIESVRGKRGGYRLTRSAESITVLDVVRAIEGDGAAFVCTEIRQRGPCAAAAEDCQRACSIARVMIAAEEAWRSALRDVSIRDVADDVDRVAGKGALTRMRSWLAAAPSIGA